MRNNFVRVRLTDVEMIFLESEFTEFKAYAKYAGISEAELTLSTFLRARLLLRERTMLNLAKEKKG